MHTEFLAVKNIYETCGLICSNEQEASESTEYAAATFQLNGKKIIFRLAKITPAKNGQFVAIWKRNNNRITAPFELTDRFDFIIIATRKYGQVGQFIFSKSTLLKQGIISGDSKHGKRGIRVYPPWDKAESKQAHKTQEWQLNYFVDFSYDIDIAIKRFKEFLQN